MVPGCPDTLIESNIRAAAIELCEKAPVYQQELDPVTTVASIFEYDLEPPSGTVVHKIMWVVYKIILHRSMGATTVFETPNTTIASNACLYQGFSLRFSSPRPFLVRFASTLRLARAVIWKKPVLPEPESRASVRPPSISVIFNLSFIKIKNSYQY